MEKRHSAPHIVGNVATLSVMGRRAQVRRHPHTAVAASARGGFQKLRFQEMLEQQLLG